MSTTTQEKIILEVLTRLTNGLPALPVPVLPPAGVFPPHRSIMRPLEDDELPTYAVMVAENSMDDSQPEPVPTESVYRRCLWLYIEVRALGDPANPDGAPDLALEPHVDFISTVMLTDEQLDGLCDRMEFDRVQYHSFQGDRTYAAAALVFRLYYLGNPL